MENLDKEFMEFTQEVFKGFGLDCLSSKLISILYIEPEEVSIEELSKKTGYSLASISNKTRFLEGVGAIKKIKKPGTKKIYYFMEKDITEIMKRKLEVAYQKEILPAKKTMPKIISKYKDKKKTKKEKEKYEILRNYYLQMLNMEKIFNKIKLELNKI